MNKWKIFKWSGFHWIIVFAEEKKKSWRFILWFSLNFLMYWKLAIKNVMNSLVFWHFIDPIDYCCVAQNFLVCSFFLLMMQIQAGVQLECMHQYLFTLWVSHTNLNSRANGISYLLRSFQMNVQVNRSNQFTYKRFI